MAKNETVPAAVESCHKLLAWTIPLLDHFPRQRRFTLGDRLETGQIQVLEALVEAAYGKNKGAHLARANRALSVNRHLGRLALELKIISLKRHEHGARLMDGRAPSKPETTASGQCKMGNTYT